MTDGDFDALYRVLGDSDNMKHYPHTFDENCVQNWIFKNRERYLIFGFGLWAVCLKESGELIGDCGLIMQNIDGTICPEIGCPENEASAKTAMSYGCKFFSEYEEDDGNRMKVYIAKREL